MDEILTFVLVIVSLWADSPATVIPGYESKAACETAAKEVAENERKTMGARARIAYCIPGPTRKS